MNGIAVISLTPRAYRATIPAGPLGGSKHDSRVARKSGPACCSGVTPGT